MNLKKAKKLRKILRDSDIDPTETNMIKIKDSRPRAFSRPDGTMGSYAPAGTFANDTASGRSIYQSHKFQ
jgi:hypothetical protein